MSRCAHRFFPRMLSIALCVMLGAGNSFAADELFIVHRTAVIGVSSSSFEPPRPNGALPRIDDFEDAYEGMNSLGGDAGVFKSTTGAATANHDNDPQGSTVLRIDYDVAAEGSYAGYFTKIGGKSFVPYGSLSFRVKGAVGGEFFKVQLSTNTGTYTKASVMITDVMATPVTTAWQTVTVPLLSFFNLTDLSNMKELVFVFEQSAATTNGSATSGAIFLDDITVVTGTTPAVFVIDRFNDSLGSNALGGNMATFASDGSVLTAAFGNGVMTSRYTLIEGGYGGHSLVLGGGTGRSGEEPEGWQPVVRSELLAYKGVKLNLQPSQKAPYVKVELKVRIKGLEGHGWITAFRYFYPTQSQVVIPFDGFRYFHPVEKSLYAIDSFADSVTAIQGMFGIVYEYNVNATGVLAVDEVAFVKTL